MFSDNHKYNRILLKFIADLGNCFLLEIRQKYDVVNNIYQCVSAPNGFNIFAHTRNYLLYSIRFLYHMSLSNGCLYINIPIKKIFFYPFN